MPTQTAKKCFAENLRLFGNAQTQPEKYNLFNGLHALAEAVEDLTLRLGRIETEVGAIRRHLRG